MLDALLPVAPYTLLLFVAASLALNVTPGPDMIYVLANGLRGGLRSGIAADLGITLGAAAHVLLAALGLTACWPPCQLPWMLFGLLVRYTCYG